MIYRLVYLVLLAGMVHAQTFIASVSGTVQDATGGVVPGVKVSVTDVTTGTTWPIELRPPGGMSLLDGPTLSPDGQFLAQLTVPNSVESTLNA